MSGSLLTTIFALIFYLTSGIFGGDSGSKSSGLPKTSLSQSSLYPRTGTISSKQVNIRSNASTSATIIGAVTQGTQLTVYEEKNGWMLVETPDAKKGWVAKGLVNTKSVLNAAVGTGKVIAGYYAESSLFDNSGYQALANNLANINTVIPFSYKVDQYGTISGKYPTKAASLAKSGGKNLIALVNNIQGNNFNSNTIHRMLTSATARSKAVNGILRMLLENGYRGVNIDFENVPAKDRLYLTAFFRELAAALRPKGLLVTASVPAKTYDDQKSDHSGAYNYQGIAPYLDQVIIMAYDEHYAGGPAGPVASYPWFEKVITYSKRYFPASKIVMGIAGYGYDWSNRSGKARNNAAIESLIAKYKVTPKWHPTYRVPYFTYRSWGVNHEVWYENLHSTAAKVNLVKKHNLRGVAVWRLGYEDPAIWKVIRQTLL
ncbi:MAG TPA: glycosyl hydrolase family 18 protein [Bacillota bacterium]